ncbi:MAG: O-acetyl-ADP-ribose deacetylase [Gallionellaceae bacterium]|jgi:ADP-ribosyl-[dinitrogen reductase] hydrolase|nr:O-acetyl-ADP-ribose deacetylase [Gallionellaceae bacterium]
MNHKIPLLNRYQGSLLGLACGDAVGVSVEFLARGSFPPVTGMSGGGIFNLEAGKWTDDTSMALCLAESLVEEKRFDPHGQMTRYLNWWRHGYFSSTGTCFDIGGTTRSALARFEVSDNPYSGSDAPNTAGNGSLMRLAPVALFFHPDLSLVLRYAAESSRLTHAAPEAVDCCRLLAFVISRALSGLHRNALLLDAAQHLKEPAVLAIANGSYLSKSESNIRGSGYAVESLEASLWCIAHTNSFRDAILAAANLGDDADTTAAITGQIAGALYGRDAIPQDWLDRLYMRGDIEFLASQLYEVGSAAHHASSASNNHKSAVSLRALQADITTLKVDAIVNAANSIMLGGGGVDGAIHRAAGSELKEECRTHGGCKTGDAKTTRGYHLPAKFVIHTVGPIWDGGARNEAALLASCYRRSIEEAVKVGARTVAFPSISTGAYGYPFEQAARIAVDTVREMLNGEAGEKLDEVIFCCYSAADLRRMEEALAEG